MTRLESGFQERQDSVGLAKGGAIVELWLSPGGDTWTILLTWPNGKSCILSAGDYWLPAPKNGT